MSLRLCENVRFGPKTDIGERISDVRFTPESRHVQHRNECLLCAISMPVAPYRTRVVPYVSPSYSSASASIGIFVGAVSYEAAIDQLFKRMRSSSSARSYKRSVLPGAG